MSNADVEELLRFSDDVLNGFLRGSKSAFRKALSRELLRDKGKALADEITETAAAFFFGCKKINYKERTFVRNTDPYGNEGVMIFGDALTKDDREKHWLLFVVREQEQPRIVFFKPDMKIEDLQK